MKISRFEQIEGLRGVLAVWVAVSHMAGYSGIRVPVWASEWLINGATHGVHVFMIVSGFVIAHLILEANEAYIPYLTRRFFRLFPAFLVACFFGWLTYDLFIAGIAARGDGALVGLYNERAKSVANWPIAHIFAHLTLLHGAVPAAVLPQADGTFIGTGWSVSLEWQFYIVAPVVISAVHSIRGALLMLAVALLLWKVAAIGGFGTFQRDSLLFAAAPYFFIGIGSRLIWPCLNTQTRSSTALLLCSASLFMFTLDAIPVLVWLGFLAIMANNVPLHSSKFGRFLFWLGRISYSIYLIHIVIIGIVMGLVARLPSQLSNGVLFLVFLASLPAIVAVSSVMFRYVELPGIGIGRALAFGSTRKTVA